MAQLDLYLKLEHDVSILEDFYSGVWAAEFINPVVETLRMYRAID